MEKNKITIGGIEYNVSFSMYAIQQVLKSLNIEDYLAEFKDGIMGLDRMMEVGKFAAFHGIEDATYQDGKFSEMPFSNADELSRKVLKMSELTKVVTLFNESFLDFFTEPTE